MIEGVAVVSRVEHDLPARFEEFCTGGGGAEVLRELWRTQRNRRLPLVDAVLDAALADPALLGPLPEPAEARAILKDTALLRHPQVGAWAAYTMRRHRGHAKADAPLWIDFGVLHTLALITAARAGLDRRTRLPARDGRVMLPTLGMARFDGLPQWSFVDAETHRGRIRLSHGDREVLPDGPGDADGWWELRRLVVGDRPPLSLHLDDLDPFREFADPVAPRRLDEAAAARWAGLLAEAWSILRRDHRATADALAEGVECLVPITERGHDEAAEAFGSVLIPEPADAVDLAVSLVREFQHRKLDAVTHLVDLTDEPGHADLRAPWRDDPTHPAGLVRGLYAHVGVAEFRRVHRLAGSGRGRRIADFEFAYARGQVEEALKIAAHAPGLRPRGRDLVAGLRRHTRGWRSEPVDRLASATARLLIGVQRGEWRLRHLVPDDERIRTLADAWSTGRTPRATPIGTTVVADRTPRWSDGWQGLARRHVSGRLPLLTAALQAANVSPADAALITGDPAAPAAYAARIGTDAGDLHAWAGLSMTAEPDGALRRRPEIVRAVHAAIIAGGGEAAPVPLAAWLRDLVPATPGRR
jgi:HEXXH motif-containing protein